MIIFIILTAGLLAYNSEDRPPQHTTKEVYEVLKKEKEQNYGKCTR